MDGDPGLPPTEVRPTPDEHAGDDDASQYEPTSRANSQVARELIRKGQALSSQGPESLRSRSHRGRAGRSGARSPSPVGSDRHRHGDIVMYDPQADLARGNPMPQSMTQFNQHVANVHLDPSMTINQEVTNYQQVNATQNNAQFNHFVNQDTGPMVAQLAQAAKSASPLKSKIGRKSQNLPHAKFARFSGWGLWLRFRCGRAEAPPRGWWPSGLASVSEAGPGLGSSLARALFCVAVSWFRRAAGSFFSWLYHGFLLPAARHRWESLLAHVARLNFPYYSSQQSTFEACSSNF